MHGNGRGRWIQRGVIRVAAALLLGLVVAGLASDARADWDELGGPDKNLFPYRLPKDPSHLNWRGVLFPGGDIKGLDHPYPLWEQGSLYDRMREIDPEGKYLFLAESREAVQGYSESGILKNVKKAPESVWKPLRLAAEAENWRSVEVLYDLGIPQRIMFPAGNQTPEVEAFLRLLRERGSAEFEDLPYDAIFKGEGAEKKAKALLEELQRAKEHPSRYKRLYPARRPFDPAATDLFPSNLPGKSGKRVVRCVGCDELGRWRCFAAGTLVQTERGERPIETILPGDRVWALDPETGDKRLARVARRFVTPDQPLVRVHFASDSGAREWIKTTPGHPFGVLGKGWMPASALTGGDPLASASGESLRVERVDETDAHATVYNLEVEGAHTYYVGSSAVLVHNQGCAPETMNLARGPTLGRARMFFRAYGPAAAFFAVGLVTDALRADSLEDFGYRAAYSVAGAAAGAAALFVIGLIPVVGPPLAFVVGAAALGYAVFELASAIEDRFIAESGTGYLSQFKKDVELWLNGSFHPEMFAAPPGPADQGLYYD